MERIEILSQIPADDYPILFATGGREALEITAAQLPDLILLGVRLVVSG